MTHHVRWIPAILCAMFVPATGVLSASPGPGGYASAASLRGLQDAGHEAAENGASLLIRVGVEQLIKGWAISHDARLLATGGADQAVRIWDLRTGEERAVLKGHTGAVHYLEFSPDDQFLATAAWDATPRLWRLSDGQLVAALAGHRDQVECAALSPDGLTLATGSRDRTARLWDTRSGRARAVLRGHGDRVTVLAFAPDSRMLATGDRSKALRLWDVESGRLLSVLGQLASRPLLVTFSPDGRRVATDAAEPDEVALWDAVTDHRLLALQRGTYPVFSPGGALLAMCGRDSAALLDSETGAIKSVLKAASYAWRVVFSPDGRTVATGHVDGTVQLWNTATGQLRAVLKGHRDAVFQLAFSPDGGMLASGGDASDVRIWDAQRERLLAVLEARSDNVQRLRFARDGRTLVVGALRHSDDGHGPFLEFSVWQLTPPAPPPAAATR